MNWKLVIFMAALKASSPEPAAFPIMTALIGFIECDEQIKATLTQLSEPDAPTDTLNKNLIFLQELRVQMLKSIGITDGGVNRDNLF